MYCTGFTLGLNTFLNHAERLESFSSKPYLELDTFLNYPDLSEPISYVEEEAWL